MKLIVRGCSTRLRFINGPVRRLGRPRSLFQCEAEAFGLVEGFFVFGVGGGICYDARADMVVGEVLGFFVDEGTDDDAELGFAIEPKVAEGAGIESTGDGLEFGDDFARSLFRCSGYGATRGAALEGV